MWKGGTEIRSSTEIAKDAFQMLRKVVKNRKTSLETKNRVLNCYLISVLPYVSEFWTIFSQMKNILEKT